MISRADKHNRIIGQLIGLTDFPLADPGAVGRGQPTIYGALTQAPCLPVNVGGQTTLTADVTDIGTVVNVTDNTRFTPDGVVYIDDELVHYGARGGATQLLNCARAVNNTVAAPHPRGARVVQSLVDFLLAASRRAGRRRVRSRWTTTGNRSGHRSEKPNRTAACR